MVRRIGPIRSRHGSGSSDRRRSDKDPLTDAKAVWRGHDSEFTQAMATELGILVQAERAVITIFQAGQSTMEYAVHDGSIALSILSGGFSLEVSMRVEGQTVSRRMQLTGLPAQRVMGHCAALVNRIQARWCAEMKVDDPRR
jgi:hypothetical protein